jgi:hypothetical protein
MPISAKLAPDTDNYFLGKGALYFDRRDTNDLATGELDLGNATNCSLKLDIESKEHFSSRKGVKSRDKIITVSEKWAMKFILEEYSKENLNMAIRGEAPTYLTQTAGAFAVLKNAKRDRWIDVGYRSISAVVVTHGATTFVANVDYKIDAVVGRVMPLSTGAIYEDEALTITFSYAAISQPKLVPSQRDVIGFLRFVPNNDVGPWWEAQIWRATLKCDGDINFLADDWGKLSFTADIDDDADNHPTEPYFRLINQKATTIIS